MGYGVDLHMPLQLRIASVANATKCRGYVHTKGQESLRLMLNAVGELDRVTLFMIALSMITSTGFFVRMGLVAPIMTPLKGVVA